MGSIRALFFLVFTLFVAKGKAFAYTDPGSGAMLWQLLLATILSAVFTVRYFFQRIKTRVFRVKNMPESNEAKSAIRNGDNGPRQSV
jgi:hypothetical protein